MRAFAAGPGSQALGGGGPLQLGARAGAEPVLITVRFHCKERVSRGAGPPRLPGPDAQKLHIF